MSLYMQGTCDHEGSPGIYTATILAWLSCLLLGEPENRESAYPKSLIRVTKVKLACTLCAGP